MSLSLLLQPSFHWQHTSLFSRFQYRMQTRESPRIFQAFSTVRNEISSCCVLSCPVCGRPYNSGLPRSCWLYATLLLQCPLRPYPPSMPPIPPPHPGFLPYSREPCLLAWGWPYWFCEDRTLLPEHIPMPVTEHTAQLIRGAEAGLLWNRSSILRKK